MALDISIKDYPETAYLVFDVDDPIYWFLYPYFEDAWRETGEMIDLYGNAEFFAEQLLALFLVLEKAADSVSTREEQWTVTVGYQGHERTPIEKPVTKTGVLDRIESLKQMANHAYNIDRTMVCLGD